MTKINQNESNKSTIAPNDTINESYLSNIDKCLIGKWFIPHLADINITFYINGTFVYNDFNRRTEEMEVLRGTFKLEGNKLILKYSDRPYQTFNFTKGKGVDDNYYITKGKNYYFVKSDVDN
ncbi:MAG: hypothetical protein PHX22_10585 [Dysgonamonadaceae bacterium]|nr:hypothetical protein [Dysgonamonadaceae bacterium]MDD4399852.1 hypothetical protein [Dysgonamonadaceae bacterium]